MTIYFECSHCGRPASREEEIKHAKYCSVCGGLLVKTSDARREMHESDPDNDDEREDEKNDR